MAAAAAAAASAAAAAAASAVAADPPPGMPCPADELGRHRSVMALVHSLLQTFAAGSGYQSVWIRDTNTFLDMTMESCVPFTTVRAVLLQFLQVQVPLGAGYEIA